jgi:hypothetical protein
VTCNNNKTDKVLTKTVSSSVWRHDKKKSIEFLGLEFAVMLDEKMIININIMLINVQFESEIL